MTKILTIHQETYRSINAELSKLFNFINKMLLIYKTI